MMEILHSLWSFLTHGDPNLILCGPITAIAGALGAIGGVVQTVGAIKQGEAQGAADDYNATVSDQNAALARQQASENARVQGVQSQQQIGNARASIGASGITTEGSALDVLQNSASNAELDKLKIIQGGEVKANAYEQQAYGYRTHAGNVQTSAGLSAAGTLLGTTGKALGAKWSSD